MAVKIQIKKNGCKKAPFYRIVVADFPQPKRWSLY